MKAGVIFAGCGPILILTTYKSFSESDFIQKLGAKGIKKFIVYEVPVELVKNKYGEHYDVIIADLITDLISGFLITIVLQSLTTSFLPCP
jgi:hypothetical protein